MAASALDFLPMGTNAETLPHRAPLPPPLGADRRGAVLAVARSTPATVASRTKSLTISFTSLGRTLAYSSRSVKSPHLVLQNPQPVLARNRLRSDRPSARRNSGRPVRGKKQSKPYSAPRVTARTAGRQNPAIPGLVPGSPAGHLVILCAPVCTLTSEISATFYWCRLRGLNSRPSVYKSGRADRDGRPTVRIKRATSPSARQT